MAFWLITKLKCAIIQWKNNNTKDYSEQLEFWTVNLIMRAIVNQSSDFPVRRTGSYRHKKSTGLYDINTATGPRRLGPFFIFITSVLWCRWAVRLVLLRPWYEKRNIAMSVSVLCVCLSVRKHPRNCTFSGHHFRACYLWPTLGPSHSGVAMRYFLPVFDRAMLCIRGTSHGPRALNRRHRRHRRKNFRLAAAAEKKFGQPQPKSNLVHFSLSLTPGDNSHKS